MNELYYTIDNDILHDLIMKMIICIHKRDTIQIMAKNKQQSLNLRMTAETYIKLIWPMYSAMLHYWLIYSSMLHYWLTYSAMSHYWLTYSAMLHYL